MFNPKHTEKMKFDFNAYRNVLFAVGSSIGSSVKQLWFMAMLDDYLAKTIEHFARSISELESFLGQVIPFDAIIVDTEFDTESEEYMAKKALNLLIARKLQIPVILLDPACEADRQFSIDDIDINKLNVVSRLKKPINHEVLLNKIIGVIIENLKNNEERKLVKEPKKVLLAVDDDSSRNELSDILSCVLAKGTAYRADDIETIKMAVDNPQQPDLIIIDVQPDDDKARAILKLLLLRKSRIPVIFIDSQKLNIDGIPINDINVVAHIARPLDRIKEFCIFEKILMGKEWRTYGPRD